MNKNKHKLSLSIIINSFLKKIINYFLIIKINFQTLQLSIVTLINFDLKKLFEIVITQKLKVWITIKKCIYYKNIYIYNLQDDTIQHI